MERAGGVGELEPEVSAEEMKLEIVLIWLRGTTGNFFFFFPFFFLFLSG